MIPCAIIVYVESPGDEASAIIITVLANTGLSEWWFIYG